MFLWVAAALLSSACLVTDPLDVQLDAGPPKNQPVVILESSVTPNNWDKVPLTRDSTPPCQQTFRVAAVSDDDVRDNLVARWFVDCKGPPDATNWKGCLGDFSPLDETGVAQRVGPSFTLASATPGLHIVKLMISDGFDPGRPEVLTGHSVASYEWAVEVASECRGTTP